MDHSLCEGRFVTEFGCGCNKKATGVNATATARRVTVYEVQKDGLTVAEFGTLPEARAKAVAEGGRVKVSSKIVE